MKIRSFLAFMLLLLAIGLVSAQDSVTELRMTWYNDGNEGDVMRAILDDFEAENPDIRVVMDTIAYADLHTVLQGQVEAGTPPDMARITDVARFAGQYLDLTDLVEDSEYWTASFPEAVLNSLRADAEDTGVYGFPTQFTVTGPFVNLTLFEQAGVDVPGADGEAATWEQWIAAAEEVASATETPYALGLDPRGHRFWGFSLPYGATYINDDGTFTVDTEGFRAAATELMRWQSESLMPAEAWLTKDLNIAKDAFINGQVVFWYSGSWQIASLAEGIGDTFDWAAVANPVGPADVSTGIPGGAVLVGFGGTQHPEEVARVMDYLASEDVLARFSAETLFIPGHLGLAEAGIEYPSNNEDLNTFLAEIPNLDDQAYALQYNKFTFVLNPAITDRLSQMLAGELTLDEAIEAIQTAIDEAVAADAAQ